MYYCLFLGHGGGVALGEPVDAMLLVGVGAMSNNGNFELNRAVTAGG